MALSTWLNHSARVFLYTYIYMIIHQHKEAYMVYIYSHTHMKIKLEEGETSIIILSNLPVSWKIGVPSGVVVKILTFARITNLSLNIWRGMYRIILFWYVQSYPWFDKS